MKEILRVSEENEIPIPLPQENHSVKVRFFLVSIYINDYTHSFFGKGF